MYYTPKGMIEMEKEALNEGIKCGRGLTDRTICKCADGTCYSNQKQVSEALGPLKSSGPCPYRVPPKVERPVHILDGGASPAAEASRRAAAAGDWLNSLSSAERKECALFRGFVAYFPDAMALVARHSVRMNEKHNPGEPVHWSRGKSSDHDDCIERHSANISNDPESKDGDGAYHIVCRAWRAMAALQEWAEGKFSADGFIE